MDDDSPPPLYYLEAGNELRPWGGTPEAHKEWMDGHAVLMSKRFPSLRRLLSLLFLGKDEGAPDHPVFFEVLLEPLAGPANVVREPKPPLIMGRTATFAQAMMIFELSIYKVNRGA